MYTKRLVAAAVIAIVIASPALGQRSPQQRQHSATQQRQHSPNPAYDVYVGGQYVGSIRIRISVRSCSAGSRAASGSRDQPGSGRSCRGWGKRAGPSAAEGSGEGARDQLPNFSLDTTIL